jgi:hypothetical protein
VRRYIVRFAVLELSQHIGRGTSHKNLEGLGNEQLSSAIRALLTLEVIASKVLSRKFTRSLRIQVCMNTFEFLPRDVLRDTLTAFVSVNDLVCALIAVSVKKVEEWWTQNGCVALRAHPTGTE